MNELHTFLKNYFRDENFDLQQILNGASNRSYFRVRFGNQSYIVVFNENIKENRSFLYFSQIFKESQIPVPKILQVSENEKIYLQEDLGNENLLQILQKLGENQEVEDLYKKSLTELVKLQTITNIDFYQCYDFSEFNEKIICNDLNYFKFYFLQPLEISFSEQKLLTEFFDISLEISQMKPKGLMYRDFQARNILVTNKQPYFIDYQGGMYGNLVYDLISLLWQAKAQLSDGFKSKMKTYYFSLLQQKMQVTSEELEKAYQYCLLIRLTQVLGAYGFRGILQRKAHFLDSIFAGISNLKSLLETSPLSPKYPELKQVIEILTEPETQNKLQKSIHFLNHE